MSLSLTYYKQAEGHAIRANELAADARETRTRLKETRELIKHWDEIMADNPVTIFAFIFVLVALGEFVISLELYQDLLPGFYFIIPLVIIGITIVVSHWLAGKFIASFRVMEYDLKRNSKFYSHLTDEQLRTEIKRKVNLNFIYGLLLGLGITLVIFYLSVERVNLELEAGLRTKGFGFYDSLPVLFYIAEIFTGVYIMYLMKRIKKAWLAHRLARKLETMISLMVQFTNETITSFERSEQEGYNILENTVSESIHIAYYRNKECNPADEENYIAEPVNTKLAAGFQIKRADPSKALNATVHLHTEYNYVTSAASNEKGEVEFLFESFPGDLIKKIIVEFSDGVNCEDTGSYLTDNKLPHALLFVS